MNRRHHAVTLQQASAESPTPSRLLTFCSQNSSDRLKAIEPLIPPGLRGTLQAGPIDGTSWCLLVSSNSAAAKLRQILPALQAHFEVRGWEVNSIRLKVQTDMR